MLQNNLTQSNVTSNREAVYAKKIAIAVPEYYRSQTVVREFCLTRFFDIIISLSLLIFLLPLFIIIAVLIKFTSYGPVIFTQSRVGRYNTDFKLYKFRTMYVNKSEKSLLTIGLRDKRISKFGYFLRQSKLDELPQLFNVLKNEMSIVGPRPEVRKYVNFYSPSQQKVLDIKPGITDYASIEFINESEILGKQAEPEAYYIKTILPRKISLSQQYADNKSLNSYFDIIIKTFFSVSV